MKKPRVDLTGWRKVIQRVAAFDDVVLKVGLVGDKAEQSVDEADPSFTMVQLAGVHEYGAAIQQSWGVLIIPARPFIRPTLAVNEVPYTRALARLSTQILEGKRTARQGLGLIGERIVADIRARIRAGIAPENAASTVARKKSTTPLVDTGRLIQSISYVVDDTEG